MTKPTLIFGSLLATAVVVGCGPGPVAPHRSSLEGSRSSTAAAARARPVSAEIGCVPFVATGSPGSVEMAGGPPPAPLDITVRAEGRATHLGRYSSTARFVVTFTSPTTAVFEGGGTFTAANGDELAFAYAGDFFPGQPAGGLGTYEFAGGTGRFQGATGGGVFQSEGGDTTFDGSLCPAR